MGIGSSHLLRYMELLASLNHMKPARSVRMTETKYILEYENAAKKPSKAYLYSRKPVQEGKARLSWGVDTVM